MKLFINNIGKLLQNDISTIKRELCLIIGIVWIIGLFYSWHNHLKILISDFKMYAGLSSIEKSRIVFGTELPDFAAFCQRIIPEKSTVNWEVYNSQDQFRLAYYLLYPRKLSPEPEYLIIYRSGTNSSGREYAFHPIDISIKIPDNAIDMNLGENIDQSWISGSNTHAISQINLFIDNDGWTKGDYLQLDFYQGNTCLRTIINNRLESQSTGRTTFVFDPYINIMPSTVYSFTIKLFTKSKYKTSLYINSKILYPTMPAIRFGKPQPYSLCYQVFHGYTNYSILTTYTKDAYILVRNK